jgi:hypothetical protein
MLGGGLHVQVNSVEWGTFFFFAYWLEIYNCFLAKTSLMVRNFRIVT